MRTSRPGRLGVIVTAATILAGTTLVGSASSASAAPAPRQLTIQTTEFSFRSPSSVPAGWTRITIRNIGGEDHQAQVARLNPGVTFDQLRAAAAKANPAAVVALVTPIGGPNAVTPGQTATTIDDLTPGQYALICFVFSQDGTEHDAKGMVKALTVTPAKGSTKAPKPVATVALRDFSFAIPARLSGHGIVAVKNEGTQSHELALYRLQPGKTLDDARRFLLTPPGTPPPIPAPGTVVGGITGIAPGATGYVDLKLKAGTYVAVCFFPDPTRNGLPHAAEGMIQDFTIR